MKSYSMEELDKMIEAEKGFDNKGKQDLAIHKVAASGDIEGVKYLLNNGYKITTNGYNKARPIHYAVQSGNYELVKFLLERKSKPGQTDKNKKTPLHYISKNTGIDIIKLLVEKGADINSTDKVPGWNRGEYFEHSPFYYAILYGNEEVVDFFFDNAELIANIDETRLIESVLRNNGCKVAEKYLNLKGKSLKKGFDDLKLIFRNNINEDFAKELYKDYGFRYKGIEADILKKGDGKFFKLLEDDGFDFSKPLNGEFPIVFVYRENTNKSALDYILKDNALKLEFSGDKNDFYFDFYGTGISIHYGDYSSLLLEAVKKKNFEDMKRFLEYEEISDIIIFAALDGLFYYHNSDEEKLLEYLTGKYYDKINPFRAFTKDKENLIDVLVKHYGGDNKLKVLKNLATDKNVKIYLKDNYFSVYDELGFKEEKEIPKSNYFKDYKKLVFEAEGKTFEITALKYNKFEIKSSDGKTYKSLPKTVGEKEKDLFKSFKKNLKDEYKELMELLEYSLKSVKGMRKGDMKRDYKFSRTFKDILTGVLWVLYDVKPQKGVVSYSSDKYRDFFFFTEDETALNLDGEEIVIENNDIFSVAHPLQLTKEQLKKAGEYLEDYEIQQPVEQIERLVYIPKDGELDYIDDFAGLEVDSRAFRRKFHKTWSYGKVGDHGIFNYYEQTLPWVDWLKIKVNFSGYHIKAKLVKEPFVTVGRIEFSKKLKEIDRIYLSELYRDFAVFFKKMI